MKTQVHFDVHVTGTDAEKNEKHFMPDPLFAFYNF